MANSQPPPKAYPLTAPTIGFLMVLISFHYSNISLSNASINVLSFISFTSAPAAKALSDPVNTMHPTSGSASNSFNAYFSSSQRASHNAFNAFGLFNYMKPTPPSFLEHIMF